MFGVSASIHFDFDTSLCRSAYTYVADAQNAIQNPILDQNVADVFQVDLRQVLADDASLLGNTPVGNRVDGVLPVEYCPDCTSSTTMAIQGA